MKARESSADLRHSIEDALNVLWSAPVNVHSVRPFGDGHSGFTYLIELEGAGWSGEYVARLSPPGARIAGPADVGRQGRLMATLHRHGLAVPQIIAADSSGLVNGSALAVMERVDGVSWQAAAEDIGDRAVAALAISFLRQLGDVDPNLPELAEPLTTLTGDLDRWRALLGYGPDWLAGPAQRLYSDLVTCLPDPWSARLVHGDFHYGNMLFRGGALAGVVDWEIATINDQRLDFGCLAVSSLRRRYPEPNPTGGLNIGFSELADMFDIPVDEARWFTAAACLKYAAILGYNLVLHRRGKRLDPLYEKLTITIRGLADDGLAVLRGHDPPAFPS